MPDTESDPAAGLSGVVNPRQPNPWPSSRPVSVGDDWHSLQRVLVVDDEPMVREVLVEYLRGDGYEVDQAGDGPGALQLLERHCYDLVMLDIMLPGMNGSEILQYLRATSTTPVIIVTALDAEVDRVAGLELGADDYVVKPFSPREVVARARSVLRRTRARDHDPVLAFGSITVDLDSMAVERNGESVELTRREFELLSYLVARPNLALSRDQLLADVWASSSEWQNPATVTVHISRLRQKLEQNPAKPDHLLTAFGVGYLFAP